MPFTNDNSFGLVIGVGQRSEDSPSMKISISDAEHLGTALSVFCRFPNVQQLLGEEATCYRIKRQLKSLADSTQHSKADLVVIYFSGHGCRYKGQYYLIGRDTMNDQIPESGISGQEFVTMLQAIQADRMLVLLDCCHAEGMTEPEEVPFAKSDILDFANRVVITAGHKSQVSYLSKPVSVFTYALIEGLGGIHFQEGDKSVTVFDLAMYIRERVVTLSKQVLQISEPQKPQLHVLENQQTSNFIVARFANGQPRRMFFDEDFSDCSVNEKSIDPRVTNIEDQIYREKFKWLNLTVVGDGNYLFTDVHNSTITIHNGISIGELKDIFREYQPLSTKMSTILKDQPDDASKKLYEKIDIADIELLIEVGPTVNLKAAIDKFLNIVKVLKPRPQTYTYMVNLNQDFTLCRNRELAGMDITGKMAEIRARFIEIIDDYKFTML